MTAGTRTPLAAVLLCIAVVLWATAVPKSIEYAGIRIEGQRAFVEQTRRALALLQSKAPEAFGIVQRHVGRIRQAERSGMRAEQDPPTYEMADATAFYS